MFNEDVSGSKLVAPLINGIDMEEFLKTAILNDFEQLFEIRPFIESVEAKSIFWNYICRNLVTFWYF